MIREKYCEANKKSCVEPPNGHKYYFFRQYVEKKLWQLCERQWQIASTFPALFVHSVKLTLVFISSICHRPSNEEARFTLTPSHTHTHMCTHT